MMINIFTIKFNISSRVNYFPKYFIFFYGFYCIWGKTFGNTKTVLLFYFISYLTFTFITILFLRKKDIENATLIVYTGLRKIILTL